MNTHLKIAAITNCPAGIAHTYMVAEAFEKRARELGHEIHVETQGASGVENQLTATQIQEADYVILAVGKGLSDSDRARFSGKKVIDIKVSDALKEVKTIFDQLEERAVVYEQQGIENKTGNQKNSQGGIMSHLMAGVSAALPFVVGGGLLVALASIMKQFGAPYVGIEEGAASLAWVIEQIGYLGFTFMIPIMGAYIAYSIADKPGLAPAFIITYFANNSSMLGRDSGAGFFGAIFFGITIGYFAKWIKSINYSKNMKPVMNMTVIPFVTTLIFGIIAFYLVGPFLGEVMTVCLNLLNNVPPEYKIPLGLLIGAMICFDMGGPINKIAWMFTFSLLSEGVYTWYAIVGVAGCLPPMAAGIAALIRPKLFSEEERGLSLSAIIVGSTCTAEPAIPYAIADPIPMISANVISGAITGAITMLLGIERLAPGIGILDPLLGLIRPIGSFYIALLFGLVLNIGLILVLKTYFMKRRSKKTS